MVDTVLFFCQVGPQAIYVVGRDDDESIAGGSEISDGAASWETVEDDEMDNLENANKVYTNWNFFFFFCACWLLHVYICLQTLLVQ